MIDSLRVVLVPLLAAVATAGLTPIVRTISLRRGQLAATRPDRWSKRPVPNVGGIAIVGGFSIAAFLHIGVYYPELFTGQVVPRAVIPFTPQLGLVTAALLAALLGLVDDLVQLRPATKLAGQLAAASVLILSGVGVWLTGNYVIDVAISAFWFVGITNALNLLDNMDGVAAGVGMIAAAFMGVGFLLVGQFGLGVLAFAFAGSLAGFLTHNYPPARIFMGDSGSLFIGIFLAGLALSPAPGLSRSLFAVIALPLVVLAVPILDTTFVTVTRLLEGRSVSQGGRDHTSHGLVALGFSEERTLWILWTLSLVGGGLGLLVRTSSRTFAYVLGAILIASLALFATYLLSDRMKRLGAEEEPSGLEPFKRLLRWHRRFPLLTVSMDVLLMGLAYFLAYLLRWDDTQLAAELVYFQRTLVIVIVAKVVAFTATGAYAPRWRHFGLSDGFTLLRSNVLGTLLAVAMLLLSARIGLSRGVIVVDLFVCFVLTLGGRLSFRLLEGAKERWSVEGISIAVVGTLEEAELVRYSLVSIQEPKLRLVAVVDTAQFDSSGGRFHGRPVFGGVSGLEKAVAEYELGAVVLVDSDDSRAEEFLSEFLQRGGGLDVFCLSMSLDPWDGSAGD
jgi:UDP-GlcNAc:undecaprenyl-phosphate/decaprenyl-phosphate GlcNAc-1-phosphate transferase